MACSGLEHRLSSSPPGVIYRSLNPSVVLQLNRFWMVSLLTVSYVMMVNCLESTILGQKSGVAITTQAIKYVKDP